MKNLNRTSALGNPVELNDHFSLFAGLPKECSTSGNVLRTGMVGNVMSNKNMAFNYTVLRIQTHELWNLTKGTIFIPRDSE